MQHNRQLARQQLRHCQMHGSSGSSGQRAAFEILKQPTLKDDVFYKDVRHVTRLFRDMNFDLEVMNVKASAGVKPRASNFNIGVERDAGSAARGSKSLAGIF